MKFNLRHNILLLSYSLIITIFLNQSVLADRHQSDNNSQDRKISFSLPTPPSRGTPLGRHRGGGSRSACQDYQNLTALVPISNHIVWGKTTATHPEFLFYLPKGSAIEFVLQDDADNYIYQTSQQIPLEDRGIASIAIPPTASPLTTNKTYQWTLSLFCDRSGAFVYVQGSVEKVILDPKIQTQLQTSDEVEKAIIYAREGIWYEAIATLAKLRREHPNDNQIDMMWTELLEQVNLTEVSSQPMLAR